MSGALRRKLTKNSRAIAAQVHCYSLTILFRQCQIQEKLFGSTERQDNRYLNSDCLAVPSGKQSHLKTLKVFCFPSPLCHRYCFPSISGVLFFRYTNDVCGRGSSLYPPGDFNRQSLAFACAKGFLEATPLWCLLQGSSTSGGSQLNGGRTCLYSLLRLRPAFAGYSPLSIWIPPQVESPAPPTTSVRHFACW